MYKKPKMRGTSIERNTSTKGETIEQKVDRILNNGEPITDGAPTIYTERKDGVIADYNPRADKQEIAVELLGAMSKSNAMKREKAIKDREIKPDVENPKKGENGGGTPSTHATNE